MTLNRPIRIVLALLLELRRRRVKDRYRLGAASALWDEFPFPDGYVETLGDFFRLIDVPFSTVRGSIYGERFSGSLPRDGDYTIRVYLMGDAKSSGKTASYTLDIDLSDRPVSAVRERLDHAGEVEQAFGQVAYERTRDPGFGLERLEERFAS